jgi:hypothetical protein
VILQIALKDLSDVITAVPTDELVRVILEFITFAPQYDSSVIIVNDDCPLHLNVPPNFVPVDQCRQKFKPAEDSLTVRSCLTSTK